MIGSIRIQTHILVDVLPLQKVGLKRWKMKYQKCPPHASVIDIITECADRTYREEDTDGITGFMYGCACSILEQEWKYGDEFKQWRENERNK